MRNGWLEDRSLPTGLVAHIKKLGGEARNIVLVGRNKYQEKEERIMAAWQGKARIGQPVQVLGRECASLWESLSYSIHQKEDAAAVVEEIRSLKNQVKACEARGEEMAEKHFTNWSIDVSRSFGNVKAHFDGLVEELKKVKEEQATRGQPFSKEPALAQRLQIEYCFLLKEVKSKHGTRS
jgi:hypothetical protein